MLIRQSFSNIIMHLTSTWGIIVWSLIVCFVCVWFCLFMCLTEGDSSCQRCVLGSKERKLGFASAVVEQWTSGCRLQRWCMNYFFLACFTIQSSLPYDNALWCVPAVRHLCIDGGILQRALWVCSGTHSARCWY